MEAQIVAAPLHVRSGERNAERLFENGQILEEDLFLEILGPCGDEDALAAENRGDEVGECLPCSGARFRKQHTAVREDVRDRRRHFELCGARLESIERGR